MTPIQSPPLSVLIRSQSLNMLFSCVAFFPKPFGTANASLIFRIKGGLPACVPFRQAQGPEPVEGLRLIHLRRAYGGQVGEARGFD